MRTYWDWDWYNTDSIRETQRTLMESRLKSFEQAYLGKAEGLRTNGNLFTDALILSVGIFCNQQL